MSKSNKLLPPEAYPLAVFIVGILSFASFRLYKLATNPYVQYKRGEIHQNEDDILNAEEE